jgi:hypothetical protein
VKPETAPEGVVGIAAAGKNVIMGKVGQNLLDLAKKKSPGLVVIVMNSLESCFVFT